ncbi:peptidyl-alpha-hydroxyglycine alpha-amidating lyase family protein [Novosphingobium sp.]|uniref:peptidyl-alpha-hydroxyglycine alpha-amidating lyase family protein n=1 Tax=Novosphingobium sp. TaxID=1874826 RepID=UPI003BAD391B
MTLAPASFAARPSSRVQYQVAHGWPDLPAGRILGSAAGVAVNSKQEVLVFHRADRVWSEPLPLTNIALPTVAIFDSKTGRFLREWGANLFSMPHGIFVDDHDNVWLTDVALQQIFKFSPDGRLLMVLGERGVAGADDHHFNRPTQVAVLPDGSFYVADGYINTRVVKFSPSGKFLFQWGRPGSGPGEFNTPHSIAVDKTGLVYVADRENDRVQIFTGDGRFVRQIRSREIGRPYGLALLPGGRMVVADGGEQPDTGLDRSGLAVITTNGRVLQRLGRYGNYDGQFRMAHAVAVDARNEVFVVDITGQRVQKFTPVRR